MLPKRQPYSFGSHASKNKLLDKKVPENPRYKHVKPVVDSGNNIRKHIDALKEAHRTNLHRIDEVFQRIRLSAFVRLAVEYATDTLSQEQQEGPSNMYSEKEAHVAEKVKTSTLLTPFQSVLVGIGELDLQNEQKCLRKSHHRPNSDTAAAQPPSQSLPYLLLDVRRNDEYLQCHIITSKNYPYTMLSRSPGYETKDLLLYKNNPEKLIIIYDEDESLAPRVATTLVQRGYDNIFVLTGGLKLATEKFPDGLVDGIIPAPLLNVKGGREESATTSKLTNYKPKEKFTEEDISKLQRALDLYFQPAEGPAPPKEFRERARTCARRSQISTFKNPPWK